jgi:hypothetical protein
MAADSDESLRIASVELRPPASGFAVEAGSRKTNPVVRTFFSLRGEADDQTLAPAQSLTRVFRIRRTGTQDGKPPSVPVVQS